MAALLRWRPSNTTPAAVPSIWKDNNSDRSTDYSYSYSFALEYKGPALSSSDIPQAAPINIDQIPTAYPIPVDGSLLEYTALPIVYPIPLKTPKKPNPVANNDDDDDDADDGDDDDDNDASSTSSTSTNYFSGEVNSLSDNARSSRRPSIVTFQDPDSGDFIEELSAEDVSADLIPADPVPVKPKIEQKIPCHRCTKGNRFKEKEACIVCDARYCRNCVLRAMGAMPEGRKCIVCIGFRIDESRRSLLGKRSKMLKKIFGEEEVKRILSAEVSCALNQLQPDVVFVNDEPLDEAGLQQLQGCLNPPTKLRPGSYWYDKVSGFWGKVGHKPSQIISAQLKIGGKIRREASNGNTGVLINNREITKQEAWMLKVAGIQCEGNLELLVTEDGSFSEVGQKNIRGKIWEKATTRALCKLINLPMPPITATESGEKDASNNPEQCIRKLLLLGYDKSGTSTIFKQAKLLNRVPFTEHECENIKLVIQKKLYEYMGILLEACNKFAKERSREETLKAKGKAIMIDEGSSSGSGNSSSREDRSNYLINSGLKGFSDWLLKVLESRNLEVVIRSANCDYARLVVEFWTDEAIQATYNRRNEIAKLPKVATYFLERTLEIVREDYAPSDMDILYADGISNGVACAEFSLPRFAEVEQCSEIEDRYQLIRAHPNNLEGSHKWLSLFENIKMVIFCVNLSDYDEVVIDETGSPTNKMLATKNLFQKIVTDPSLNNKEFLLILNKFDLLEEKIEQVPLDACEWFDDFNPVMSSNPNGTGFCYPTPSLGQRASHYIGAKFKRVFSGLTERKLFVSVVTGLERDSVDECLRYAREIINWEEEEVGYTNVEESSASIDASTS